MAVWKCEFFMSETGTLQDNIAASSVSDTVVGTILRVCAGVHHQIRVTEDELDLIGSSQENLN